MSYYIDTDGLAREARENLYQALACTVGIHRPGDVQEYLRYRYWFFGEQLYHGTMHPGAGHIEIQYRGTP